MYVRVARCLAADAQPPATTTAPCACCCACSNATPTTRRPTSRSCSRWSTPAVTARPAAPSGVYRGRMDEVGVEPASFPASTPV